MDYLIAILVGTFIGMFMCADSIRITVPVENIEKAQVRCSRSGGLKLIQTYSNGKLREVECQDGAVFDRERLAAQKGGE